MGSVRRILSNAANKLVQVKHEIQLQYENRDKEYEYDLLTGIVYKPKSDAAKDRYPKQEQDPDK